MLRLIPLLRHLSPPATRIEVQITRYAPLQASPERFGLAVPVHEPSYGLIFSEDYLRATGFSLDSFCYYFLRSFENSPRLSRMYRQLDELVDLWLAAHREREVGLWYDGTADGMTVLDSRDAIAIEHRLDAAEAALLLACEQPQPRRRLDALRPAPAALDRLLDLGLLVDLDGSLLCLALPLAARAVAGGRAGESDRQERSADRLEMAEC
jgi:hypothetical protein